jgi:outer membrane lipoprotein SlyB
MHVFSRALAAGLCLAMALGAAACGPRNTNTTYTAADIGRTAEVSYGVIVSMRPVAIQGRYGAGALGGAVAGGAAGSYIGGDPRANILGALGGALVGGIVGAGVEQGVTSGQAVEFIIREDSGQTISVVQTNEENFQPNERVVLTRGARTRIARAAG